MIKVGDLVKYRGSLIDYHDETYVVIGLPLSGQRGYQLQRKAAFDSGHGLKIDIWNVHRNSITLITANYGASLDDATEPNQANGASLD